MHAQSSGILHISQLSTARANNIPSYAYRHNMLRQYRSNGIHLLSCRLLCYASLHTSTYGTRLRVSACVSLFVCVCVLMVSYCLIHIHTNSHERIRCGPLEHAMHRGNTEATCTVKCTACTKPDRRAATAEWGGGGVIMSKSPIVPLLWAFWAYAVRVIANERAPRA